MAFAKKNDETIHIDALKQGRFSVRLLGRTGIYFHAMSMKAKRTLVIGGGRKTAAERKEIKHDPEGEYRDSVYKLQSGPTLLGFPAGAVKLAMAEATKDTVGVAATEIRRLIFLSQDRINIWGRPYLRMDVVRSADMAHTPDIRTRAYCPEWCAQIDIAYVTPALNPAGLITLLANAGLVCGIGDNRQQKGSGHFGTFDVINDGNEEQEKLWAHLTQNEGRAVQTRAMEDPEAYDDDTRELWGFLTAERNRRLAGANEGGFGKPKREKRKVPIEVPVQTNGHAEETA